MKILLLSRYGASGASSRVRYLQYLPYVEAQGADVPVVPLFSDAYVRSLYEGRSRRRPNAPRAHGSMAVSARCCLGGFAPIGWPAGWPRPPSAMSWRGSRS